MEINEIAERLFFAGFRSWSDEDLLDVYEYLRDPRSRHLRVVGSTECLAARNGEGARKLGLQSDCRLNREDDAMKIKGLVSTKLTQGQRANDFSFVPEGELVFAGFKCTGERPDDRCGCARSLCGAISQKATTTFVVAEFEREVLVAEMLAMKARGGWIRTHMDREQWIRQIEDYVDAVADDLSDIEVGTVVNLRENGLQPRAVAA
ncbi:MAG: hypothetical protein HY646_13805 [Acidobacteria bacterium]|nr:hypothetical protein [Acidobacteriota bacterium]